MPLTFRGSPLRRILYLWTRNGQEAMYFVESYAQQSCVVPLSAIGSDKGVQEIIRVANQTRGSVLEETT